MGIDGQNGSNLARAQANADIDHPDEATAKGGLAQRQAPEQAGGLDTDDRKSDDPVDQGLWTRRFLEAQGVGQERQDAGDGAKADVGLQKELQGYPHHIHLGQDGHGLRLALELTPTRLGLFEGLFGLVSLGFDSCELFAQVTILVAALFGFVFPLISTVFDFGELTHHRVLSSVPHWRRPRVGASFEVQCRP